MSSATTAEGLTVVEGVKIIKQEPVAMLKQEPVVLECDIKIEEGEIVISREPGEIQPSGSKHGTKDDKKRSKERRKSSSKRRHKSSRSHHSKSKDDAIDSILNMPVHELSGKNKYSGMYVRCGNTMISVPRPSRHRARWTQSFPGPPPILRKLPLSPDPPVVTREPPARRTSKERLDANIAKVALERLIELSPCD